MYFFHVGANVTNLSLKIRLSGYNLSSFGVPEQLKFVKDFMNATTGIHKASVLLDLI